MKNSSKAAAPRDPDTLQDSLRIGKDEMNLVEHPFAALQHQKSAGGVFELEWEQRHPRTGKTLQSRWQVRAGAEIGLPGPMEERLYLVLLELTRDQGWPREVVFSRGDLLDRLGMTRSERTYSTLTDSLVRLQSVSIRADRSFWDAKSEDFLATVSFHLISRFKISDEPKGRKAQGQLPLSAFVWDEIVWNSFKAGHLRSLDTAFALSLNLPLSLRLFRYLDKHRYGRTGQRKGFEIELHKLCEVHLGMTASPYASKLKERLASAHHELIERGFLASVIYRKMKTSDGEKVCYAFSPSLVVPAEKREAPVKGPETAFTGLRAVLPAPSSAVDSARVLGGFLLADDEARAKACDAVFQTLPDVEQNRIKTRVKTGLAPFLQENMNTPGARGAMARGIRKEVELTHQAAVETMVLQSESTLN